MKDKLPSLFIYSKLPSLPSLFSKACPEAQRVIFICDKRFKNLKILQAWFKNKKARFYFLPAGEKTKSLENLDKHILAIIKLSEGVSAKDIFFMSLGGGSLGDLTGFLACIYKRGVGFSHIPTSPLAAIDSSHGSKNALNFQGVKNVIGTFYPPKNVFVIKSLLRLVKKQEIQGAYGELVKMAILQGKGFYTRLKLEKTPDVFKDYYIKQAISCKNRIVQKDPYEEKNIRQKLNLGHTLGHIVEAFYKIPHGESVLLGLLFSAEWSYFKKYLSLQDYKEIKQVILKNYKVKKRRAIPVKKFKQLLEQDKKRIGPSSIRFIFIKKPGSVLVKKVSLQSMVKEARRQGWIS